MTVDVGVLVSVGVGVWVGVAVGVLVGVGVSEGMPWLPQKPENRRKLVLLWNGGSGAEGPTANWPVVLLILKFSEAFDPPPVAITLFEIG